MLPPTACSQSHHFVAAQSSFMLDFAPDDLRAAQCGLVPAPVMAKFVNDTIVFRGRISFATPYTVFLLIPARPSHPPEMSTQSVLGTPAHFLDGNLQSL
jgi:hypothetical protein